MINLHQLACDNELDPPGLNTLLLTLALRFFFSMTRSLIFTQVEGF